MSKIIKITPELIEQFKAEFDKALASTKVTDGKFTFTKSLGNSSEKATIRYSSSAWVKQARILKDFDKEVAWHGVASRYGNEEDNVYLISDILVYPQTITATTVEMDTEEYAKWLMENCEDERFESLYMQAHSHVNMGTTPSGVDLTHQEEILRMVGNDGFYIFLIWNKSGSYNAKIYDLKKNVLFETSDITIVLGDEEVDELIKNAQEMVKQKKYCTVASANNSTPAAKTETTPAIPAKTGVSETAAKTASANSVAAKSEEKKSEKGGNKGKKRTRIGSGWSGSGTYRQTSMGCGWADYDDELYDMYGEAYRSPYFYRD